MWAPGRNWLCLNSTNPGRLLGTQGASVERLLFRGINSDRLRLYYSTLPFNLARSVSISFRNCSGSSFHVYEPKEGWRKVQVKRKPRNSCFSLANQRSLFDRVAQKFQIKQPNDWSKITYQQLEREGARPVLQQYSSLLCSLRTIYPEIDWTHTSIKTRKPNGYWRSIENQRKFFDGYAVQQNITNLAEWDKVTYNQIAKAGGKSILTLYSSLASALETIYPGYRRNSRSRTPNSHWSLLENQREFFDAFAVSNDIKTASDWSKITHQQVARAGGQPILNHYSSLKSSLEAIYPEFDWETLHMQQSEWKDPGKQRKFFDNLAQQHNITCPRDWSMLTYRQIEKEGGKAILSQYSSLLEALITLYPEKDWNSSGVRTRASNDHWSNLENQRKFFDKFAAEHNINQPSDWSKIRYNQVTNAGGASILRRYPSMFEALQSIYPHNQWNIKTHRPRVPRNFWNDEGNVKSFIENFKETHHIAKDEDWHCISIKQIQQAGGSSLVKKYNSLANILRVAYPENSWDPKQFQSRYKRSAQRWMFIQVQKIHPNCEVVEEYLHEELTRVSGKTIEFDVFVPSLQLAFEYHGQHHYQDSPALGCGLIELHQQRDTEKVELCKTQNISLVVVPYWWDNTISSLRTLIRENRTI